MRFALCIHNPKAGRAATSLKDLVVIMRRCGYDLEIKQTRQPRHATELARQAVVDKADLVIAAGGDGTISEVACGLALSTVPLAVAPCGTANVLAREVGLPLRIRDSLLAIPGLEPIRIALGKGGSRYFLMMAGIGFDADIVYGLDARLKERLGTLAFWLEGLRHWASHRFGAFLVTVNGTTHPATFAVIGRTACYAGSMRITSKADLRNPTFDVCLFQGQSRFDYLRYLGGVSSGIHPRFHDVVCLQTTSVQVRSESPVRVQMDGESVAVLPMDFEIVPDALTLLVPPAFLKR